MTAPASAAAADTLLISRRIVAHNVVHLRKEPKSTSELVSQTLLGRPVTVLRTEEHWSYVESDDAYRGWAESRWLVAPDGHEWTPTTVVFTLLCEEPRADAPLVARLPILNGVYVEARDEASGWATVQLPGGAGGYLPLADLAPLPAFAPEKIGAAAAAIGRQFLGTPYLWGGSSSYGLDCSGFVQLAYRLAGLTLRRDADIQRDDPRFVPVEEKDLLPGDLIFFGKPDRITHVGMFFAPGKFIHSSGGDGVNLADVGTERHWPRYVDARRLDPAQAAVPVTPGAVPAHRGEDAANPIIVGSDGSDEPAA